MSQELQRRPLAERAILRLVTDDIESSDQRRIEVDEHERRLIRRMLSLSPEQRLRSVAAAYPLVRVGLVRRLASGGTRKAVSGAQPPPDHFDPVAILRALVGADVRFVLVGGLAATLRGSPTVTYDVDLAAEQSPGNLARLVEALRQLGAVRFKDTGAELEEPALDRLTERVEQFAAPVGYIDVLRELRAVGGYADLARGAEPVVVGDVEVLVASLDDVIRSKEAAGRPKDLAALPVLRALREELHGEE